MLFAKMRQYYEKYPIKMRDGENIWANIITHTCSNIFLKMIVLFASVIGLFSLIFIKFKLVDFYKIEAFWSRSYNNTMVHQHIGGHYQMSRYKYCNNIRENWRIVDLEAVIKLLNQRYSVTLSECLLLYFLTPY